MDQSSEGRPYYVADDHGDRGEVMLAASFFLAIHGACWFAAGALAAWWFLKG
jgi:hypothetical protein